MILFGKSDWRKAKPFSNKDYMYSYEYFYDICKKGGIQMYRASYEWYDYKNHIFKHAWVFEGKGGNWKKVDNIKPDLIYDKTKARMETYYKKELIGEHYPFINDLCFTRLIDDKFITSLLFSKWSKRSWVIKNNTDLKMTLKNISSSKLVAKPLSESGGNGIFIIEKKKYGELPKINSPYIVQDFIDSSRGVPGVSQKMHDLRLVFINNKLMYSYIREPQEGSFLANLAQGGSLKIVPENKLPRTIFPVIKHANKIFAAFEPRIYSIDFMFDEKKQPWVVELNSMPGLFFTPEEKPCMIEMYRELLKVFKKKLQLLDQSYAN
ncbi:MAG: ATP-grasp protein [Patescibacteria group bacterium]|nr:ATP-grasp protein [Patescibacteria group bacterium]